MCSRLIIFKRWGPLQIYVVVKNAKKNPIMDGPLYELLLLLEACNLTIIFTLLKVTA